MAINEVFCDSKTQPHTVFIMDFFAKFLVIVSFSSTDLVPFGFAILGFGVEGKGVLEELECYFCSMRKSTLLVNKRQGMAAGRKLASCPPQSV